MRTPNGGCGSIASLYDSSPETPRRAAPGSRTVYVPALCVMPVPVPRQAHPIVSRQDLCFSKVVSKCTSFVIVSQAFETTVRDGLS